MKGPAFPSTSEPTAPRPPTCSALRRVKPNFFEPAFDIDASFLPMIFAFPQITTLLLIIARKCYKVHKTPNATSARQVLGGRCACGGTAEQDSLPGQIPTFDLC